MNVAPARVAIISSIGMDLARRFRRPAITHKPAARLIGAKGNAPRTRGNTGGLGRGLDGQHRVAPEAPGVTVGGAKVAVAPAGRPEADMMTTLSKAPPMGGTAISMSTDPPALTVNGAGRSGDGERRSHAPGHFG